MSETKRVFDVLGALGLLIALLPLLLIVAALIAFTSRGPVLFRQTRCGLGGRPFTIYKFRSMYIGAIIGLEVVQAKRSDPRVTPIGRFIRRASVDELPQLVNVLCGDMSLIGPRPHAIEHDQYYSERIPFYVKRFAAKPGLSGLAQANGFRGETPQLTDMARRVRLDLVYIRTASVSGDVRLLAATVREMFFSSTAF
ncbi:sugar transferase [uncultured Enterovirga sp.]|uniref:sugar transferase n=1 Tax=uncultured Enterovirga sp. TaxID=2026352 RepID=UPI0035C970A6